MYFELISSLDDTWVITIIVLYYIVQVINLATFATAINLSFLIFFLALVTKMVTARSTALYCIGNAVNKLPYKIQN